MKRSRMLLGNILIIAVIMILTLTYIRREQERNLSSRINAFENMTVAMENVTTYYLEGEQQVCVGWANYINANDLTAEQAIDFVSDASFTACRPLPAGAAGTVQFPTGTYPCSATDLRGC